MNQVARLRRPALAPAAQPARERGRTRAAAARRASLILTALVPGHDRYASRVLRGTLAAGPLDSR